MTAGSAPPAPAALRGMTWDHPRAYQPLEAFAGAAAGGGRAAVRWDRQSLADFEARPITELAREYDLMIIDHPGLGAALAGGALRPLEEFVPPALLARWRAACVGPTWRSYTLAGRQWAAPADAATQVSVLRPGLLGGAPGDWADVPAFAGRHRTALCLGGPHAFLLLLAMCASARPGGDGDGELLPAADAVAAIEILRAVWRLADQDVSAGDPIGVHEALAADPDLAYCPLAFGYASYARPAPGRRALAWSGAPAFRGQRPGTVLGGTGLAVSARPATRPADVLAFLTAFLDPAVQAGLVPEHAGQPADVAAWDSPAVDRAWGGYYTATRRSVDAAWIRPRLPGWIPLQDHAAELVREAVTGPVDPAFVVARINAAYRTLTRPVSGSRPQEASTS